VTCAEIVLSLRNSFQQRYVRRGGQWVDLSARWSENAIIRQREMPKPGVIMESLGLIIAGNLVHEPLKYIEPYFGPHEPVCPDRGSKKFQKIYGEPVEHFAGWCL
jgi:hypothetical protein